MIELMVVVVIMSVVVSVGILSLGRFSQDLLDNQQAKIESYIKQVSDQAVFGQQMYLIVPDAQGLTTYRFNSREWLEDEQLAIFPWHDGFMVSWELDETFVQQQQLPRPGWVFWPSGEAIAGKIHLKILGTDSSDSTAKTEMTLSWDETLVFAKQ
ncbi:hypothetical protein THMIRHAM_21110 [Thiomicrorhabdus immobilis]|uniref:Uncharacterized protein n=1 Tax=Thiomicrorhabdus immobilis TaxID=2791037 RepID=A0ABN6CZ75_9GAMM|nr:hypothetical protein THMIRHAM_21110 [Thiomicrorhabdus immobilis]